MRPRSEAEFEQFFADTYPAIVRSASWVVRDLEVAREVAQEAFVQAAVHWRRVSGYENRLAWVRKVAFRLALRTKEKERQAHTVAQPLPSEPEGEGEVFEMLSLLTPMQRAAIALYYLDDLPVRDVARALGCSESTARVHLHRGRQSLLAAMNDEVEDA